MRKLKTIACFAACMACSVANAQDLIVKRDGTIIQAKVTKVSKDEIEFKKWSNQDGPQYTLPVSDIFAINYMNGEKDTFDHVSAPAQPAASTSSQQPGITQVKIENLSPEAKAANEALIAKHNQDYDTHVGEIEKNGNAKKAYARLGVSENSVLENEDIAITIGVGVSLLRDKNQIVFEHVDLTFSPKIQFKINNKTDNTLYIDLGNTFFVSMGLSYPYYVPTSSTTTSGSSSGAGINLGAVAGALGVGGGLATLASGVNVGGGKTSGTSTTTYSQRFVAVPPHACYILESKYLFGDGFKTISPGLYISGRVTKYCRMNFSGEDGCQLKEFDVYSYAEPTSPLHMSFVTVYSKTEDFAASASISSAFYLKTLYGGKLIEQMAQRPQMPVRKDRFWIEHDEPLLLFAVEVDNKKNQPSFPLQ
ncbi:MAG: hypothetical protein MR446_02770 [Bacteroidales bacterium]|nr:hypothetical protein [Bacteroidales bacterium]